MIIICYLTLSNRDLTTGADDSADLEAEGPSDIAGNVFFAPLEVGIDGLVGVQTLQDADVLVGTDEVDQLIAVLNGTGAGGEFAAPTIEAIEEYYLTAREPGDNDFAGDDAGLDLFNATGYTQLWNLGSSADLTLINVRESAAIGLDGVVGDTEYGIEYTSSADTTVQNVIANAVGTSAVTGQADLDIDAPNGIDEMNLQVSNTVRLHLEDDAANMRVFNIDGSGLTQLSGDDDFDMLEVLNASGYTGPLASLELDVSGSEVLTSVTTTSGDDRIVIDNDTVNGGLIVAMAAGADALAVETDDSNFNTGDINSLLFTGGVTGVETLEFVDDVTLGADATLNLDGFDGALSTISFQDVFGGGNTLALANGPETLTVDVAESFDWVDLDTGATVDLTINVNGADGELDIDSLTGGALETLSLNQTNGAAGNIWLDITSDINHDVSALQSVSADAAGDANVDIDASDVDADIDALTSVSVVAGNNADLEMDGVAPVQQVQSFAVTVVGLWAGEAVFIVPGVGEVSGDANSGTGLSALVADLNADLSGSNYEASLSGNTIVFTKLDGGPADPIILDEVTAGGLGGFSIVDNGVTTPGVDGDGFLGVEEVVVDAGVDADVELTDVYGEFTLMVTAGDDAWVDLTNTNVVGDVSVVAVDHADVDVTGSFSGNDYFGNPNLTSLTIESATADVTLANDLGSFVTLDVSDVATNVVVDAGAAEYAEGSVVTYLIGATQDGTANTDVEITAEGDGDVREVFQFTGDDIGEIVINNFDDGDLAEGDRDIIDFSQIAGVTSDLNLQFADANGGNDVEITAASGEFDGSIYLVGMGSNNVDAADLEQFNINYV